MISNSGHDENGRYSGGKAGDQTGKEWAVIPWYNRPWTVVLRFSDEKIRHYIATLAREAANNDNIGYDQSQRTTFWLQLKQCGYRPKNIKTKCEGDCSAGVTAIVKATGYLLGNSALRNVPITTTAYLESALKKAGAKALKDKKYLTSDNYLLEGDILLYPGHHTAINLDDGSLAKSAPVKPKTKASTKKSNTEIAKEVISGKWGSGAVRQEKLHEAGYDYKAIQKIVNKLLKGQLT